MIEKEKWVNSDLTDRRRSTSLIENEVTFVLWLCVYHQGYAQDGQAGRSKQERREV